MGLTTNFSNLSVEDLENISNVSFGNAFGEVRFDEDVSIGRSVNLNGRIVVGDGSVFVDSVLLPEFNVSARLILYNLSFVVPIILRDDVVCLSCVVVDDSEEVFIFDVVGFSEYRVIDGDVSGDDEVVSGSGSGGGSGGGSGVVAGVVEVLGEVAGAIVDVFNGSEEVVDLAVEEEVGLDEGFGWGWVVGFLVVLVVGILGWLGWGRLRGLGLRFGRGC